LISTREGCASEGSAVLEVWLCRLLTLCTPTRTVRKLLPKPRLSFPRAVPYLVHREDFLALPGLAREPAIFAHRIRTHSRCRRKVFAAERPFPESCRSDRLPRTKLTTVWRTPLAQPVGLAANITTRMGLPLIR